MAGWWSKFLVERLQLSGCGPCHRAEPSEVDAGYELKTVAPVAMESLPLR